MSSSNSAAPTPDSASSSQRSDSNAFFDALDADPALADEISASVAATLAAAEKAAEEITAKKDT